MNQGPVLPNWTRCVAFQAMDTGSIPVRSTKENEISKGVMFNGKRKYNWRS